jgi:kynureninase
MKFKSTRSFAQSLDRQDPLKKFRSLFHFPVMGHKRVLYFIGNSLGLQPKSTEKFIKQELQDWATLGVEGHLHAKRPWLYYHTFTKKNLAQLVGAKSTEVVAMNQLTVNLHLLLVSFFRPTKLRYKMIVEAGAFSSDQYAFETQLNYHGLDPSAALIELKPREGEQYLRTEDIISTIQQHGEQTAVVILGAVQYYTGQFFDVKRITEAAHAVGAYAGFDCAHAIGNVELNLHKNNVDFAVWCSYKYLNSGPGSVAGAFVHERHSKNTSLPRFAGWWGHDEQQRFLMKKGFIPIPGADGWQVSNFPVLTGAAHLASLEIFAQAGIKKLRKKSVLLTGYLEFLLQEINHTKRNGEKYFTLLTPSNPNERGCQLSIFFQQNGKKIFAKLTRAGVVADWREPGVIRIAPVPLYNTFEEVFTFSELLKNALRTG